MSNSAMLDLPDFSQFLKQLAKELNAIPTHLPASEREPIYSKFRAKADLEAARQHCGTSEQAFEAVIDGQPAERRQDNLSEAERWLIAQNIRGRNILVDGVPLPGLFRWYADGKAALGVKPEDRPLKKTRTPQQSDEIKPDIGQPLSRGGSAPDAAVLRAHDPLAKLDLYEVDALAVVLLKRNPSITEDALYELLEARLPQHTFDHLAFASRKSFSNYYKGWRDESLECGVALAHVLAGYAVVPLHHVTTGKCSCGIAKCTSPGRHPRTPNGIHDASVSFSTVYGWWSVWRNAPVGIVTGKKSGLTALEVDPGGTGHATLANLIVAHGPLPSSPVSMTLDGVEQYWFQHNSAIASRELGPGLRAKAGGQFIIARTWPDAAEAEFDPPSKSLLPPPPAWLCRNGPVESGNVDAGASTAGSALRGDTDDAAQIDGRAVELLRSNPLPTQQKLFDTLRGEFPKASAVHPAFNSGTNSPLMIFAPYYFKWLSVAKPPKPATALKSNGSAKARSQHLTLRNFNEIQTVPIRWLWPGFIARGKLTVIAGHPGLGKSQITAWLASVVSVGAHWPTGEKCDQGSVLFICAEDSPGDTIKPRLEAWEAEMGRIRFLESSEPLSLKTDLDALRLEIEKVPDLLFVVVDPITAYLDGVDSHKNAEVRSLLMRLSEISEKTGIAFVVVTHLNKTQGGKAVERVTGSVGLVAAARAAFLVDEDPDDPDKRLFLSIKSNLAKRPSGRRFHIESVVLDSGIETSRIVWGSVTEVTADEALGDGTQKKRGRVDEAEEFILSLLAGGPVAATAVYEDALKIGISRPSIDRAKRRLKIQSKRDGAGWIWLPSEPPE